jgi:hypothetical protein
MSSYFLFFWLFNWIKIHDTCALGVQVLTLWLQGVLVPTPPSLISLSKSFLDHATTLDLVFGICKLPAVDTFYLWISSLTFIGKRTKIWLDHLIRVYIDNFHEFWWIYEFTGTIQKNMQINCSRRLQKAPELNVA